MKVAVLLLVSVLAQAQDHMKKAQEKLVEARSLLVKEGTVEADRWINVLEFLITANKLGIWPEWKFTYKKGDDKVKITVEMVVPQEEATWSIGNDRLPVRRD